MGFYCKREGLPPLGDNIPVTNIYGPRRKVRFGPLTEEACGGILSAAPRGEEGYECVECVYLALFLPCFFLDILFSRGLDSDCEKLCVSMGITRTCPGVAGADGPLRG